MSATPQAEGAAGVFDIAIIGGGVNGCGIARDAAGRGLSVVLLEQGDLAGGTSSASTKLIHGGLRYLEHGAIHLVREALREREVLWSIAPHIIWPLRLVLPVAAAGRPAWMLRLGLWLYDHLGGRRLLPAAEGLDLRHDPRGAALKAGLTRGFAYSDCRVEDARLVVLNARDAADRGAFILPRTRVAGAQRGAGLWSLSVESESEGGRRELRARVLVNAAGPWVAEVQALAGADGPVPVRLVQGSHIVVRRLYRHEDGYILQNADGRVVFALPFGEGFTLIGTTDRDFSGRPEDAVASPEEIAYLCAAASAAFATPVTPHDVVWSYAGVRALYDAGRARGPRSRAQDVSRDYGLVLEAAAGAAPLLTVYGGKITTYRRLAEAALARLAPHLPPMGRPWTREPPLPGGDFPCQGFEMLVVELRRAFRELDPALLRRLAQAYGTRAHALLAGVTREDELGDWFGAHLCQREVDYLMDHEWARRADDILWRRTRLGLDMSAEEADALDAYMAARATPPVPLTGAGAGS